MISCRQGIFAFMPVRRGCARARPFPDGIPAPVRCVSRQTEGNNPEGCSGFCIQSSVKGRFCQDCEREKGRKLLYPAPLYANGTVRAHAHIGHLGEGDIDFDRIFKTLREIGFNQQEDTIATFNPLGFPERAISDSTRTREIIEKNLVGVPDITEPMHDFGMYAR